MATQIMVIIFKILSFRYTPLAVWLLFTSASAFGQETNHKVQILKEYLAHPKEIEHMLVRNQWLITRESTPPTLHSASQSTNEIQWFRAAWKPDAFYLEQRRSIKELGMRLGELRGNPGLLFTGRVKSKSWNIVNTNIYCSFKTGEERSDGVSSNDPIQVGAFLAERILNLFSSFGLNEARPRAFKWTSNNEFTADYGNFGGTVNGTMLVSNDLPTQIRMQDEKGRLKPIVEFTYLSTSVFPTTVRLCGEDRQALIPFRKLDYLAFVLATNALSDDHFAPEQFIDPHLIVQSLYTNGAFYDIISNQLVLLESAEHRASRVSVGGPKQQRIRLGILFAFVAVTAIFARLFYSQSH